MDLLEASVKTRALMKELASQPTRLIEDEFAGSFPVLGDELFDIAVDYDRHPAYAVHATNDPAGQLQLAAEISPHVLKIMQKLLQSEFRDRSTFDAGSDAPIDRMLRDGATGFRADLEDRRRFIDRMQGTIAAVREKRAAVEPSGRGNVNSAAMIYKLANGPSEDSVLLERILTDSNVIATASQYMGKPLQMIEAALMIKDETDTNLSNVFRGDAPDPQTIYMHIDTDRGRIKAGFYLSEVGAENGPFSYIMGSNRARMSLCERAMRIASDTCGLDGPSKHSTRRRFMMLPQHSRTKANFGNDLDDASGQSARLVEKEKRFTSADGDLVLFDNRGFHRGGIVDKGERIVVFVILG